MDLHDPMVRRFVDALVAWAPKDWDAFDARLRADLEERARHEPTARFQDGVASFVARTLTLLDPSPGTRFAVTRGLQAMLDRLQRRMLGPAWRRQGTGPTRLLLEALDRPWVAPTSRAWAMMVVGILSDRRHFASDFVDKAYRPFEPAIPWASLHPPMLPGAAAGPHSS